MRDYTYIEGARFTINSVFRSERFDLDRLDLNWVDDTKPLFVRGYRIVDHQEFKTVTVHGEDADNIAYSMTFINVQLEGGEAKKFELYLEKAMTTKNYLFTKTEVSPDILEERLH